MGEQYSRVSKRCQRTSKNSGQGLGVQPDTADVCDDLPGDVLESPMSPPHLFHPPVCFKNRVHSVLGTVPPSALHTPPWKHLQSPRSFSFPQLWSHPTPRWGPAHLPRGESRTPGAPRTPAGLRDLAPLEHILPGCFPPGKAVSLEGGSVPPP